MTVEFDDTLLCVIDILLELAEQNENQQEGLAAAIFVLSRLLKNTDVEVVIEPEDPPILEVPSLMKTSEPVDTTELEPTLFKSRLDKKTKEARKKQSAVLVKYWASDSGQSRRSGHARLEQMADESEKERKRVRTKRK